MVKNLPPTLTELDLKKHFERYGQVTDCRIMFKGEKNRLFAFVGFFNQREAVEAQTKLNNSFIVKNKIKVSFATVKEQNMAETKKDDIKEGEVDENRLYIYNFPFSVNEEDIEAVFKKYGQVQGVKILRTRDGQSKGNGFVSFDDKNSRIKAMAELDNKIIFGRILHIKECRINTNTQTNTFDLEKKKQEMIESEKTSYKKLKRKQFFDRMNDGTNWNSLFLNPNTVMEVMAANLGLKRKDLLDSEIENPAALKTQAEQQVIRETKEFLEKYNINLSAFQKNPAETERSKTIILVKNIPYELKKKQLEELFNNYGKLVRFIFPENRAISVIEYLDEEHANNAFSMLNEYMLKGYPLYLEWAPFNIFNEGGNYLKKRETMDEDNEEEEEKTEGKTVFVKNLNYTTDEDGLKDFLSKKGIEGIKSVKIVRKEGKSCGFGFVEFENDKEAMNMLKVAQNKILDSHSLKLDISRAKESTLQSKRKGVEDNYNKVDKLIIRNLPFQTNKNELKETLKGIVNFKKLRLPQKSTGELRGFAFLELNSTVECKKAYEALQDIHFYGRKLVIEYARI